MSYSSGYSSGYVGPVVAACLLHAVLFWLFAGGHQWGESSQVEISKPVNVVKAKLVTLKKQQSVKKVAKKAVVKPKNKLKSKSKIRQSKKEKPKKEQVVEKPRVEDVLPKSVDKPAEEALLLDEWFNDEDAALQQEEEQDAIASYSSQINHAIANRWNRPPSARNNMQALLVIQMVPTGDVVSVNIKESSGNAAFDQAAVLAVEKIGRFDFLQGMPSRMFEQHFRKIEVLFRPEDLRL